MRLASFKIENFKRINFAELTIDPKTNDIIISGQNEAGKSALLEAVKAGFAGVTSKEMPAPIKKGAKRTDIQLVIDDDGKPLYIVERIITENTSRVVVSSPDGAQYPTPQKLLEEIYDKATIDVSTFLSQDEKKQLEQLREIVNIDLDFDKWALERKAIYDERTLSNSRLKDLKGELAGIELPEDAPKKRVDVSALLKEQTTAQKQIESNEHRRDDLVESRGDLATSKEELSEFETELRNLQYKIEHKKEAIAEHNKAVEEQRAEIKNLADPNLGGINEQIATADEKNQMFDAVENYKKLEERIANGEDVTASQTDKIAAKDKIKEDALKAAKFPIPDLSFTEDGITYKGVPFKQASSEEKIRVALAIGMSKKPKVKLILIRDASLLDGKNLKVVQEVAKKTGYLVIMERVDDKSPASIVIEDGYMLDQKGKKLLPPKQPKKKEKAVNGSPELF